MIQVRFQKPADPTAFDDWVRRCETKARSMRSAKDVSAKLYKEQREHILRGVFKGKCAYCERAITLDQHSGDVDHYRPKGRVTDQDWKLVSLRRAGAAQRHPGYFWLAHHWENLLPSCIACNRPGTAPDGRRVGKWDRFPVVGSHARSRGTLKREVPLLLNPLVATDDPAGHMSFDPETGRIIGKSDRGKVTVDVLDLNREGLPEARRDVYDNVRSRASAHVQRKRLMQPVDPRTADYLDRVRDGRIEFAMAARVALAEYAAEL